MGPMKLGRAGYGEHLSAHEIVKHMTLSNNSMIVESSYYSQLGLLES